MDHEPDNPRIDPHSSHGSFEQFDWDFGPDDIGFSPSGTARRFRRLRTRSGERPAARAQELTASEQRISVKRVVVVALLVSIGLATPWVLLNLAW